MKANVRGPGRRGDDLDGLRAAYVASTRDGHSAWCVCGVERLAEEHLRRAEDLYGRARECLDRGDVRGAAALFLQYTEAVSEAQKLVGVR